MAKKSNKIDIRNGFITEENNSFLIKYFDEELEKEVNLNITEEIRKYVNTDNINFKIGKGRKGGGGNLKPTYKYICSCDRVIKSTEEDLIVKCMKCNAEFQKQE